MSSINDLAFRTQRLETLLLPKNFWPDIYDFLFLAEQTIGCPPDVSPEDEALRRLGPRETFVNDFRRD